MLPTNREQTERRLGNTARSRRRGSGGRLRRNVVGAYTEEHENKAGCWLGPGFTVNLERGPNQINLGCQLQALNELSAG